MKYSLPKKERFKVCRVCKISVHYTGYYNKKGGRFGVDSICKSCNKKKTYAYRQDQMSSESKYTIARKSALKYKYGMTLEDYEVLFEGQDGLCAICSKRERQNKLLAVDHCHHTGKIRGLLCSMCNTAIGKLDDDPKLLQRALDYLLSHGGQN